MLQDEVFSHKQIRLFQSILLAQTCDAPSKCKFHACLTEKLLGNVRDVFLRQNAKKNAPEIVQSLLVFLQPRVMGRSTANNGKQRWPRCHFNSKAIEESTKTWQFYDILKCNIFKRTQRNGCNPKISKMHLETLAFTLSHCFDVGSISLISSCEKRGVFLVFILCNLPRYQERSTDLSKFMSDHVRSVPCSVRKLKRRLAWTWRNVEKRIQ